MNYPGGCEYPSRKRPPRDQRPIQGRSAGGPLQRHRAFRGRGAALPPQFYDHQEAQTILDQTPGSDEHLDYVRGRRIKLVFTRPQWDTHQYGQIAGAGTAGQVLNLLRQTHQPDHPQIRALHYQHLRERTDKEKWSLELLEQLKLPELIKALREARCKNRG